MATEVATQQESYQELYEEAVAENRAKDMAYRIHKWSDDGDALTGVLVSIQPFKETKFDTTCNSYLFDTDEGLVSTVCGKTVDSVLSEKNVGDLVHLVYKGRSTLPGGRVMNVFGVYIVQGISKDASKSKSGLAVDVADQSPIPEYQRI